MAKMNPELNEQPKREHYEPKEGIDFIIDFYAVAGLERTVEQAAIGKHINEKIKEYHPDIVSGAADEIQETANRKTILLNRAKSVLGDPEKRQQYDEIIENWTGLVSEDGRPIYNAQAEQIRKLQALSPEELEAHIDGQSFGVAQLMGYSPETIPKLRKRLQKYREIDPNDPEIDEIIEELLDAMQAEDSMLADKEIQYKEVLGINAGNGTGSALPGPDYLEITRTSLEEAAEYQTNQQVERLQLETGRVATKLFLLEDNSAPSEIPENPEEIVIDPDAIRKQLQEHVEKTLETSKQRVELVEEIIAHIPIQYPEKDIQPKEPDNIVCIIQWVNKDIQKLIQLKIAKPSDEEVTETYHGFRKTSPTDFNSFRLTEDQKEALKNKDYRSLIEDGNQVVVFKHSYRIETAYLIDAVLNKHLESLE